MKFAKEHADYIIEAYNEGKSTYQIAEELNTYPNKINRSLKYLKVGVRNRSDAQKEALASGRHEHPTKGKVHSEETKIKISEQIYNHWQGLSDKEREKRSQTSKRLWEQMPEYKKEELRKSAAEAVRKAAKNGSRMENFLYTNLTELGYNVILHKKGLIQNENLEIDLFVSDITTAIEVDGPAHFYPVWGQESLDRHIKADAEKSGLLLDKGYCIIRIKHLAKSLTKKHERDVLKAVVDKIEEIKKAYPPKKDRYIELEVK